MLSRPLNPIRAFFYFLNLPLDIKVIGAVENRWYPGPGVLITRKLA